MMRMISKDIIQNKIESNFLLEKDAYEVFEVLAVNLLTYNRFDLAFKLMFLDLYNINPNLAKDVYVEHIRAFSFGKFTEPGNELKQGSEKFLTDFLRTFEKIKSSGFDSDLTLIPLSSNGTIANGAHRVASAIYLGEKVSVVSLETPDQIYDYEFFYKRNVNSSLLDKAAIKFSEYADNVHIAFLWPSGQKEHGELEFEIPNVIYKKTIKLNSLGAHNLLSQVYNGESWLGSIDDNFKGVGGKLVECFRNFESFSVVAFQTDDMASVLKVKNKIRKIAGIGKHSVHITDTKEEAIRCARTVFSDNGIHFLNHGCPNRYTSFHYKIKELKVSLSSFGVDPDFIVLDSGMVLSVYGLRDCKDVDILAVEPELICDDFLKLYDVHDSELFYHGVSKPDLVLNQDYFFYYDGLKFVSFSQVFSMKKVRAEVKDRNDCAMMEALIENDFKKFFFSKIKQYLSYSVLKVKSRFYVFLKVVHLYDAARYVYRVLKGR